MCEIMLKINKDKNGTFIIKDGTFTQEDLTNRVKATQFNKKYEHFLLTVPHGCSNSGIMSSCDKNTEIIAMEAIKNLQNGIVLISTSNREKMDMNRAKSKNTQFQREMNRQRQKKDILHLDVHGFPKNTKDWKDHDIIIFDMPSKADDILGIAFMVKFKKLGYETKIVNGSNINFNVKRSLEKNIDALLIEVKESLNPKKIGKDLGNILKSFQK